MFSVYKLAAHFRILDAVSLLKKLEPFEIAGWLAFFELEPMAADRADFRGALHTAAVCESIQPGVEMNVKLLIPDWEKLSECDEPAEEKRTDPDELLNLIRSRFPVRP